jgi:hypothetical protein
MAKSKNEFSRVANNYTINQGVICHLLNPKANNRVHSSYSLSQMYPASLFNLLFTRSDFQFSLYGRLDFHVIHSLRNCASYFMRFSLSWMV